MDSSQLYSHSRWSVYVCVLCGRSSGLLPPNCESLTLSVSEWSTVASLSLYCCYIQCVFSGLFVGVLVFIADLYFLVKVPAVVDGSKSRKSTVKRD